jgi:hypothetical protein
MSTEQAAQPYVGAVKIDLSALAARLVDMAPGATIPLRRAQAGFPGVVVEIKTNYPTAGSAAGIPESVYAEFMACTDDIEKIDESRATVAKILEVLDETRALREHERQVTVSLMVDTLRSTARRRKKPALLAPFEKSIKYFSQNGEKAAKARRQREASQAEQDAQVNAQQQADAAMQQQLDAYKAELDAKFNATVQMAIEKALAAQLPPPAPAP